VRENLGLQKILPEAIAFFNLLGVFLFVERCWIGLELCSQLINKCRERFAGLFIQIAGLLQ